MTAHLTLDFHRLLSNKIAVVLKCKYSEFTVRLVEVQRQIGNADCVFFPSLLRMPFVVI